MEASDRTDPVAEALPGDHVIGADKPEVTLVEFPIQSYIPGRIWRRSSPRLPRWEGSSGKRIPCC
jgi:hypothetical protein